MYYPADGAVDQQGGEITVEELEERMPCASSHRADPNQFQCPFVDKGKSGFGSGREVVGDSEEDRPG